jgi:hypothetical protein
VEGKREMIPRQSVCYYSMLERSLQGLREFRMIILTSMDTYHYLQFTTKLCTSRTGRILHDDSHQVDLLKREEGGYRDTDEDALTQRVLLWCVAGSSQVSSEHSL